MKNILSVAVFAFFGGCCRYLFSQWWSATGILIANLLGAFILAFLTYYVIERNLLASWLTTGLGTGMIGAFTTFSSFAMLTIDQGVTYFLLSSGGGLAVAYLGYLLARRLTGKVENNA